MAQARAVVDVVRAESDADQLLKQVRFLVRPFRGSEPRKRPLAVRVANRSKSRRRGVERLVPRGFAAHVAPGAWVGDEVCACLKLWLAHQRRARTVVT